MHIQLLEIDQWLFIGPVIIVDMLRLKMRVRLKMTFSTDNFFFGVYYFPFEIPPVILAIIMVIWAEYSGHWLVKTKLLQY